jgi:hypothetical protein
MRARVGERWRLSFSFDWDLIWVSGTNVAGEQLSREHLSWNPLFLIRKALDFSEMEGCVLFCFSHWCISVVEILLHFYQCLNSFQRL